MTPEAKALAETIILLIESFIRPPLPENAHLDIEPLAEQVEAAVLAIVKEERLREKDEELRRAISLGSKP